MTESELNELGLEIARLSGDLRSEQGFTTLRMSSLFALLPDDVDVHFYTTREDGTAGHRAAIDYWTHEGEDWQQEQIACDWQSTRILALALCLRDYLRFKHGADVDLVEYPDLSVIREKWNATMTVLCEAYSTAAEISDGIYADHLDDDLLVIAAYNEALVTRLNHPGKIRAIEHALYLVHGVHLRVRIVLSDIPF